MRSVPRLSLKSQSPVVTAPPAARPLAIPLDDGTTMLALIQALIPLGLRAVAQALAAEGTALAGARYARDDARPELMRWGAQPAPAWTSGSCASCGSCAKRIGGSRGSWRI